MAAVDKDVNDPRELDVIVDEVVAEAHISRSLLLPEEIDYIRDHVLKKPLRVIHIWALGVCVVIIRRVVLFGSSETQNESVPEETVTRTLEEQRL